MMSESKYRAGGFEVGISSEIIACANLLEQLYQLRVNETMSAGEKTIKLQTILKDV